MYNKLYRKFKQITKPVWLQSKRVCAIKIVLEHGEYYLFNVYMPCDVSTCIDSFMLKYYLRFLTIVYVIMLYIL